MTAKVLAFFVGIVGALSALFAAFSIGRLRKEDQDHAIREKLRELQRQAEAQNQEKERMVEEEITQATAPLRELTDSKDDRRELAALLDE
jgi:gas vesicle protein